MFCSTSVGIHLLRGAAAMCLLAVSFFISTRAPAFILLIVPLIAGVFFLLRGCPMCWLMGLVETISNSRARSERQ